MPKLQQLRSIQGGYKVGVFLVSHVKTYVLRVLIKKLAETTSFLTSYSGRK